MILIIIFLSALRPSLGNDIDINIKNLKMIRNLLTNINTELINHFIYISSDAVYPYSKDLIDEDTNISPLTIYGSMHYMREQYLKSVISPKNFYWDSSILTGANCQTYRKGFGLVVCLCISEVGYKNGLF